MPGEFQKRFGAGRRRRISAGIRAVMTGCSGGTGFAVPRRWTSGSGSSRRTPRTVTRAVNLSEGGMRAELDGLFAPGDRIECALHVAVDFIRTDKRGPGMF